jgi:glycosyltransferase involved in cell wall biosynthesis
MIDPNNPDFTDIPGSPQRAHYDYSPAIAEARPFVTIITPFYNPGPVFHETARSVLQQSLQQWEWLIINDGSTDAESLSILDSFRKRDPRIRIIDHSANRGLSAARNTGFRSARTEMVVQLDSDDLLEPTAVEKWCWFLESNSEYSFAKGFTVQFGATEYLWQKGFHNGPEFLRSNLVNPTSAVRKQVHQAVGGYDEDDRGGLMDWDFWLRCASHGYWGGNIPEFLDWYRRRRMHTDMWPDFDDGPRLRAYREKLRRKYAPLWDGKFPQIQHRYHMPDEMLPEELPCENLLRRNKPRLLMLVPWMSLGGADKFNLDLLQQLTGRAWEVSVATTLTVDQSWLPHYARYTSDVFILPHLLRRPDYPRFLRYLIHSRQIDVVMISHSELGYQLLPYLRSHFPNVTFIDFCHIEEEHWKNGGYPRMAVQYQELLDLNIVSSEHLKGWMVKQGADSQRISVCYTNVSVDGFSSNPEDRATVRAELGLDETVSLILYAGRLCEQKQPDVFARTMLQLHVQGLTFVALVAGVGPDLKWLQSFIKQNKLNDCVRLLGEVPPQRIKRLMFASDIFFLPSRWEGIAVTIYEAMACGLPVVGADTGGQRELVSPETGVLLPRDDKGTEVLRYAEVLAELLKDPTRRKEMAEAGRARVKSDFTLPQMGDRMIALIGKATNLGGTEPRSRPGLGFGRACAAQAIETIRLSEVTAQLWAARNGSGWRQRSYLVLSRLYDPYYRLAVKRGWKWLPMLSERIKKALLQNG